MITIFTGTLLVLATLYACLQCGLAFHFKQLLQQPPRRDASRTLPQVSVLIPARNEAASLPDCLDAILKTTYPSERVEVIVVDDHSTDDTAQIVQEYQQNAPADAPRIHLCEPLYAAPSGSKQRALREGLKQASGSVILTTDADCTAPPGWISSMVDAFSENTAMTCGPVRYSTSRNPFHQLQAVEFAGLIAFGAASLQAGWPTICNSANLAIRRDVLEDHMLQSGTSAETDSPAADELLLQHLAYETDWEVAFCPSADAVLSTPPAPTFRQFVNQRIRWAHMGTRYPYRHVSGIAAGVWLFHALLLLSIPVGLLASNVLLPIAASWMLKVGADLTLLVPALDQYEQQSLIPISLLAEVLHPLYIVGIGIAGTFASVEWKGRSLPA